MPGKIIILFLISVEMENSPVVISTSDGSKTIYMPDMNEQYHSVNGALTESRHVFIKYGLKDMIPFDGMKILEVGFGTGLNTLLTAIYAIENRIRVKYWGLEKFPLPHDLIQQLDYGRHAGEHGSRIFSLMHECAWNEEVAIHPWFILKKTKVDLVDFTFDQGFRPNLVYFDAFAPDKQPEMWTETIFRRLYQNIDPPGVLVTYSAKGEIRRRLITAGFTVERLPGPPGKREMLRATKK
jgi:tRNA U34 5-methylaminomethyl-2-thiouridine-forming methyltransferase MnmC